MALLLVAFLFNMTYMARVYYSGYRYTVYVLQYISALELFLLSATRVAVIDLVAAFECFALKPPNLMTLT